MTLKISTPGVEGVYQGSKFLKYHVLAAPEELEILWKDLGSFSMYPLTQLAQGDPTPHGAFLNAYGSWVDLLKKGQVPSDTDLKKFLAAVLTKEEDALWKQEIPGNRYLIKISKPCVQVQAHFFTYSGIDGVFRPLTMGTHAVFWGLSFSFPQIYQDPRTLKLLEVTESPNRDLLRTIQLWVREKTRPTPFVVQGKKKTSQSNNGRFPQTRISPHSISGGDARRRSG